MKFNIFVFGLICILIGAIAAVLIESDTKSDYKLRTKNDNLYQKHWTDRQRLANYI